VKRHAVIVREGSLLRAAGIGLSAIGLGLFFFLVCLGISFFNHNGLAERVDASLKKQTEDLSAAIKDGQRPDRTDEVMAKLDDAVRSLRSRIDDYNASTSQSIAHQLDVIQAQIYDLKSRSPIIVPPKTDKDDPKIIQTEVTVSSLPMWPTSAELSTSVSGGAAARPSGLRRFRRSKDPRDTSLSVIDGAGPYDPYRRSCCDVDSRNDFFTRG
jgi:hypothetical protein